AAPDWPTTRCHGSWSSVPTFPATRPASPSSGSCARNPASPPGWDVSILSKARRRATLYDTWVCARAGQGWVRRGLMVFVLALGAALANALTSVFQRMGVERAPADSTLRLSLLVFALRRRIWLLGFALMIVSFLLQAVALHFGRLSQVQPILTTELVF